MCHPRFAVMMLALPCGEDDERITICEMDKNKTAL